MDGIRIERDVALLTDEEALFSLAADLPRYVEIEPYLESAHWVTPHPVGIGSTAKVTVEIPFALPALQRAIGRQHGFLEIAAWDPPSTLAARFEADAIVIHAAVHVTASSGARTAHVRGTIAPRSRWTRALLRPVYPLLEPLVARSIERGLRRAEAGLATR